MFLLASACSSRSAIRLPISAENGYTGSAIGIHGPSRIFARAGWMNTVADWTEGCIAVASDEAIDEIAAWMQDKDV